MQSKIHTTIGGKTVKMNTHIKKKTVKIKENKT